MNWRGVRGDPDFGDPECLDPSGEESAKEGKCLPIESGEPGEPLIIPLLSILFNEVALIHFSFEPGRGGVTGTTRKRSAKWFLINLE